MDGMLLHYRQQEAEAQPILFGANDVFAVQCIVPDAGGDKLLQFQARVARAIQGGVGLALINPDGDSLRIMQQFALQFSYKSSEDRARRAVETGIKGKHAEPLGRRDSDIVAGCGRIVMETMDSLSDQLGVKLTNRLFDLSRDSVKAEEQKLFFDASEKIKKDKDKLLDAMRRSFQERLQAALSNPLKPEKSQEQQTENLTLEEMTLIENEDLVAWLAISDVTSKVEERYKDLLTALEERLSVLLNAKISHVNNPYGPALFSESFQIGLAQFNFKESVNSACYAVLKEALIDFMPDLYAKLNDILIGRGILPKLKASILRRAVPPISAAEAPAAPLFPESAAAPHDPAITSAPFAGHNGAFSAGAGGVSVGPEPATSPRRSPPDLYQVVQGLRTLRQDIGRQKGYSPPGSSRFAPSVLDMAGARSPVLESGEYYSTSELVAAVADIQADPKFYALSDEQSAHTKSRVLAALAVHNPGGDGKDLNPRDRNVLEVGGDLLDAMQRDPLVADTVKHWLKQLDLPILKLALQDPSLFFDQAHVARQVVNNIARLEFYEASSKQNSIGSAIENLLEKVATERSDGVEIFSEILSKLKNLMKIQDKAYAENLKDVVSTCRENPPIPEACQIEGAEYGNLAEPERRKWMMFARRLREGDNVLYSPPGSTPLMLRLAWMDEQKSVDVFVNMRGMKEKVLKVSDVAAMMRLGILEAQASADDPAMDRAQYVIMQDLYKQVIREGTHDPLTGLTNRREFERQLNAALASAKREDLRHALYFINIDKFSVINDSCGYTGGDRLLQDMAGIIEKDLNGRGLVARLGNDEFGVLLEKCPLDDALAVAEQHIESAANYKLSWDGEQLPVSVSIGIVPISARSSDVGELLKAAESSCKIAKEAGGGRLQIFHAGHARVAHQAEVAKWIGKIDKMLEDDSLAIRCQRIEPVDGDGPLLPHFEILVGVKDEQGNVGPPGEFIKAAEWYNKMSAVDRYMISSTISWMEKNPEALEDIAGFTINLSGQSLNEEGFVDFILERLKTMTVPGNKICFEITETVGITNLSDATLFMERIKDYGCRFALDDFGSGMSSYGYLKNLPVDIVKIDGAFVKTLIAGSSDYAVIKSITEIAHFMKRKVVAEYVESDEILALLREIGVDYAQGFLIDKPGSIDRLLKTNAIH